MGPRWTLRRAGETVYMKAADPLAPYAVSPAERLRYWAETAPERIFLARRGPDGGWIRLSYARALAVARAVGAALLARGISAERPVVILSGNGIEHGLLALGCLYVGVPWCPVSPAYSQAGGALSKLRCVLDMLTPGLVFVDDTQAFAHALDLVAGCEVVAVTASDGRRATLFGSQFQADDCAPADEAFAALRPDTIAKFLLTSGSTGDPKAVINTNRMLCANQQMILQAVPPLGETPPVLVDWLPWNHTFGGNKVFGVALHHGGTLYIDDGRPLAGRFETTLANLRDVSPTLYFNVPAGFEMLLPALDADPDLASGFFARCRFMFYAGAGLAQATALRLEALAVSAVGRRVPMHSGLGATETAPCALWLSPDMKPHSDLGMPIPGVELKLAPVGGRMEARLKGPSVTPGYWRAAALTMEAFDEEGFYRLGDAVRFADPDDPCRGLVFDGRLAEDFKVLSGTWVRAGPLRTALLAALQPLAADLVLTGLNRADIRALVFPDFAALRAIAGARPDADLVCDPAVRRAFAGRLSVFSASKGSASRVAALLLLATPPSQEHGELTDKGTITARGVLAARAAAVERLYADHAGKASDIVQAARPLPIASFASSAPTHSD